MDYQQRNKEELRAGGDVVRSEDIEDPVDGKEDKLGGTAKDGSEKIIDVNDKEKPDWFCWAHTERKRFKDEQDEGRG